VVDHRHFIQNFQEDHTNSSRFPGFPGVVDTLLDRNVATAVVGQ